MLETENGLTGHNTKKKGGIKSKNQTDDNERSAENAKLKLEIDIPINKLNEADKIKEGLI